MIKFIKASYSLAKNIKTTGAFTETSAFVAKEITQHVSKKNKQLILEVGAGHGNITREILAKMHPQSELFSIELNRQFCDTMINSIEDPRLTIINDSAEYFEKYLPNQKIDAIISTLPLTLFPNDLAHGLLSKIKNTLSINGSFSQVYYSLLFLKHVKKHFSLNKVKLTLNFPPAFIIHSSNQK